MAIPVKTIPNIPNNENGDKALKFFIQHNGNKITLVMVTITAVRIDDGNWNNPTKVSPNTILNAKHAKNVLQVDDKAGIHAVFGWIDFDQASL
jgi:spore maturation protein SpmA